MSIECNQTHIDIFTDGACRGNPGPGGYGAILRFKNKIKRISGGFRKTTNNRMELMACIEALKAVKYPCQITIQTDSRYIVDSVSFGWVRRWEKNGWMTASKKEVENQDLWTQLLDLMNQHEIHFKWIKGHNGHPENEKCDQLATTAADSPNLPIDQFYENQKQTCLHL